MCISGRHISSLVSVGLLSSVTAAAADRGPWILHATLSAACSFPPLPPSTRLPPGSVYPVHHHGSRLLSHVPLSSAVIQKERGERKKRLQHPTQAFVFFSPSHLFMLLVYFFLYPTLTSIQSIFISFYISGTHGCKYKINSDSFVFPFVKFICLWHVKKKSHS